MTRNWLVTGSARGLGRAIVEAVLDRGDRVVATARDPGRLAPLAANHPDRLLALALDVTDPSAVAAAVSAAEARFGALDVLVNNAGYGRLSPFEQIGDADFRDQIEANFFGTVSLCRAVLPSMRQRRSGTIVNISSVGGRGTTPGLSAYQAAKWAVSGFSEVLAQEVEPLGVRVIALEPGGMRTEWMPGSHRDVPVLLPGYEASVGAVLSQHRAYAGHEVGDPVRIGRVIAGLADRAVLPRHLVLGSDALAFLEGVEAERAADAAAWRDVSLSTDFVS